MHIIRTSSNEEIQIMCFIRRFNVYFLRNQRKCSQNGEGKNCKFMRQMMYNLVEHEILKKTVYFFVILTCISRVNGEIVRKMVKNGNLKMQIYEVNDISSCRA